MFFGLSIIKSNEFEKVKKDSNVILVKIYEISNHVMFCYKLVCVMFRLYLACVMYQRMRECGTC